MPESGYHEEGLVTLPCGCTLNVFHVETAHQSNGPPYHIALPVVPPPPQPQIDL